MSRYTARLIVSPEMDGKSWMVLCSENPGSVFEKNMPFGFDIGWSPLGKETVEIPNGFITDFASIPRPLWWLLPKWGKYGKAAVIHDYLYKRKKARITTSSKVGDRWYEVPITRKEADRIMLQAMEVSNTPRWQKFLIYAGIRMGGWLAWRRS